MGARSLVDVCTRTCIKHVAKVDNLGDLPYHLARPILQKVNKPDQLREIELNSSQIEGETEELWRRLIARDFPNWEKKNYIPKNPRSWYKVYERYKREEKAEIAEAEAQLLATFGAIKNEAESKRSTIVSQQLMPRLPKEGRIAGSRRAGLGRDVPDHLSWGGGSRTKTNDARGVIKKSMREAREMANRRTLSTPTGKLVVPPGQIRKAPAGLVNEYRVKQQSLNPIRAPKAKPKTEAQMAEETARREREARLLNIKTSSSARPEQMVSDSDEEEDYDQGGGGGGYLNDLFDDDEDEDDAPPPRPKTTAPPHRSHAPSTGQNRPSVLSNSRKPTGMLLSNSYNSASQRRVVQSSTPPVRAEPSHHPRHASPPATTRPQRPASAAALPSSRPQLGLSSPPLKPRPQQLKQAGSPPAGLLKRKPQTDIFMRKPKMPRN
jgi:elongin-A